MNGCQANLLELQSSRVRSRDGDPARGLEVHPNPRRLMSLKSDTEGAYRSSRTLIPLATRDLIPIYDTTRP